MTKDLVLKKSQSEEIKELIESMDYDDTKRKICKSLISLHSCAFVELTNVEIAPFFSDSKKTTKVYREIYKSLNQILGKSDCILYKFLEIIAVIPESKFSTILDFVTILLKYPYYNIEDMNKAQVAYGIIEEYNLSKDVHRLAKELGRQKPLMKIVNNVNESSIAIQ